MGLKWSFFGECTRLDGWRNCKNAANSWMQFSPGFLAISIPFQCDVPSLHLEWPDKGAKRGDREGMKERSSEKVLPVSLIAKRNSLWSLFIWSEPKNPRLMIASLHCTFVFLLFFFHFPLIPNCSRRLCWSSLCVSPQGGKCMRYFNSVSVKQCRKSKRMTWTIPI